MIEKIEEKDYNRYLNMAYVISNKREGRDLLHNTLIKIERLKKPEQTLTDSFVFISLKNYWYTQKRLNKMVDNQYEIEKLKNIEDEEIDYLDIYGKTIEKINFIKKEILKLKPSDIKLFELHYLTWNEERKKFGYTQRHIARELNVSNVLIHYKIKDIVLYLNEKWELKNKK